MRSLLIAWCCASLFGMAADAVGQSVSGPSLTDRADAAYRQGDYLGAEQLATQQLEANPQDDVALYLRASARVERGGMDGDPSLVRQGITDAREALKIEGNIDYYLPYLYGMSRLAEVEQRPEHARAGVEATDTVLALPNLSAEQKANLYFQRGLLDMALDDMPGAIADLRKAVAEMPAHAAAQVALCKVLTTHATLQDAETQYDRACKALPQEPLVFNNRGDFLQSQRRFDEAVKDFAAALAIEPEYVPALNNRGFVYILQEKYREAETDLTQSLQIDPQQSLAFGLRAAARLYLNQIDGAVQDYQTAAALDPSNPSVYYDLGFAHYFHRDYVAAVAAFDEALALDPTIQFLSPWRYTALVFSNDQTRALQEYGAIEQKPASERTWFDVLTLYLMAKIEDDAVLAAMTTDDPAGRKQQECEANFFMGLRRSSRMDHEAASQHFQKALAANVPFLAAYRGAMYALGKFPGVQ
jgi:Tfp pilus assembly protein PilF